MNYELTDIVRTFDGVTLRQVKAVRDLEQVGVRAGAYGGFVQSAANLAQRGTCWVHGRRASLSASAVVMGRARVRQGGQVTGRAVVRDQAVVEGNATITDDSIVCDRARVGGAARISGGSVVFGDAVVTPGEDGPHILPGAAIGFDVSYGKDYVLLGASYERWMVAVSAAGAVSEPGSWDRPRWLGSWDDFERHAGGRLADDAELATVVELGRCYLRLVAARGPRG